MSGITFRPGTAVFLSLMFWIATPAWSAFVPQQMLDPASATIRLDSSYQSDAWLVYTYEIDTDGKVVNTTIQRSNGVPEVEQAVLQQVGALQFRPATRNGKPVKVSAPPVTYTWILDKAREMSPRFSDMYREAWTFYAQENYDAASDLSMRLKTYPGRNAQEEVKYQILAASLASRRDDEAAELQHLNRVVAFQTLALDNSFKNTYVTTEQYLKILNRIQSLQLNRNMLADAGYTLDTLQSLGRGSAIANEAGDRYRQAELAFQSVEDITVNGELAPLYRGGAGAWKTGLSRNNFSISDVSGRIGSVFLVCANVEKQLRYPNPSKEPWTVPVGWTQCEIDVSGEAGTRLVLHQYAAGR